MITRRGFLGAMIGGVAAAAAVREWPFRVYSFPSEPVWPNGGLVSFGEPFIRPGCQFGELAKIQSVSYDSYGVTIHYRYGPTLPDHPIMTLPRSRPGDSWEFWEFSKDVVERVEWHPLRRTDFVKRGSMRMSLTTGILLGPGDVVKIT